MMGASLLLAAPAWAQPSEAQHKQAQALFERGRTLLEAERYDEACRAFAESQRLDPGGGTLLNLALCHEKQGRIATAYTEFQEALSAALADKRQDREEFAKAHIAALEGTIPRVRFELESSDAKIRIELDGSEVPELARSTPTPIDPGTHRVVATAPGHESWQTRLEVPASGGELVVTVPKLEAVQVSPVAPAPEVESPPVAAPPAAAPQPDPGTETRLSTASWVVGGVGVAALGASAITGVLALGAQSSSKDAENRAGCIPERGFCKDGSALAESRSEADRARTLAWVSTGTLVVGGASVLVALLLPRKRVPRASVALVVSPNQVSLGGTW